MTMNHNRHQNTKTTRILKHFRTGRPLTTIDAAAHYGTQRLADVVYRLKKRGYRFSVDTKMGADGLSKFTEYSMTHTPQGPLQDF